MENERLVDQMRSIEIPIFPDVHWHLGYTSAHLYGYLVKMSGGYDGWFPVKKVDVLNDLGMPLRTQGYQLHKLVRNGLIEHKHDRVEGKNQYHNFFKIL